MRRAKAIAPGRTVVAALLIGAAAWIGAGAASAVILDGTNQCTVKLPDGTDVVLYGEYVSPIGTRSANRQVRRQVLDRNALDRAQARQLVRQRVPPPSAQQRLDAHRARFAPPDFLEHEKSHRFHYLPPGNSLRLSQRPPPDEDTPEFLFVKYTTEETAAAGGVQGGLMHFLMEWSLTPEQEADLRKAVATQCKVNGKAGELVGVIELEEESQGSFRIISATLSDDGMQRSLVQSGHAPTMPGGKVAVAANLSKHGAQLLLATVEKSRSIADLSVELAYEYTVQLPAAKGEIVFHWDRFHESVETYAKSQQQYDRFQREEIKLPFGMGEMDILIPLGKGLDESETEELFEVMIEQGVVQFNFEGYQADSEYTREIQKGMMQYFLDSMMTPAGDPQLDLEAPESDEEEPEGPPEGFTGYTFKRSSLRSAYQVKKQTVRLDMGIAVKRPFQLVGNMASWYQSASDNPKCIQTVNLNDPFFEHREVRFILDLDAKEIFEDMVNYVTVNVRKDRGRGSTDFERSLTIDQAYLRDNGVAASLTYAREDDDGSEAYEYQTQWSIRGGHLFTPRSGWEDGSWEGVTLAAPIERWYMEVEGDLDQMLASDIARVTVEMHYPLFREEQYTTFALSPRGGEWLLGDHIYVDRGTRGVAYRLIIHHKSEGRLALPWQARVGDRYVYATIPEEILVAGSAREKAKQAAKQLGRIGAEKVLDQFQELFARAD